MYTKRRKRKTIPPVEITLTPLIDTALTLLIIFMVTTPMIKNALKFELPKGVSQEGGNEVEELVVSVDSQGKIFFNENQVSLDMLSQTVKNYLTASKTATEKSVWVKIYALNTCDTLVGIIDRIKMIEGVKDVKIAMQRPATQTA